MYTHYSVPKEYIGKRADVVYDADMLAVYYALRLITTHLRNDTPYSYTQKDAHQLSGRKSSYEQDLADVYRHAVEIDNEEEIIITPHLLQTK